MRMPISLFISIFLLSCGPGYGSATRVQLVLTPPADSTDLQRKQVIYECKHNAALYAGAYLGTNRVYPPGQGGTMYDASAAFADLAVRAKAGTIEEQDFHECLEAHGWTVKQESLPRTTHPLSSAPWESPDFLGGVLQSK
jgi:hypothetical protein